MKSGCRVRYYACNEFGHIRRDRTVRNKGNKQGGSLNANCPSADVMRAAWERERRALVDTRCSFTLVGANTIQER